MLFLRGLRGQPNDARSTSSCEKQPDPSWSEISNYPSLRFRPYELACLAKHMSQGESALRACALNMKPDSEEAGVVENEKDVANIPRFSEYMAQVKGGVKRAGESVESLEAAAKETS